VTVQPGRIKSKNPRSATRWFVLLIVVSVLTALPIVGILWWQDRPLNQARQALVQGETQRALELVDCYLQVHPQSNRAHALKARVLVDLGQSADAIRLFEKVGYSDNDELHAYAQAMLRQQQWAQALPILEQLLQKDSKNVDLLYEIAVCRASLGFINAALETAKELTKLPDSEARGNLLVGMLQRDLDDNESAVEAWEILLRHNPNAEELQLSADKFFFQYGCALMEIGRPKQALEQLRRSIALRETALAHTVIGEARFQLGEPDLAITAWQAAVTRDPTNRGSRVALAREALAHGKPRDALNWLEPIKSSKNLQCSTAYLLQRAYTLLDDLTSAAEWRQRAETLRKKEQLKVSIQRWTKQSPNSFWSRVIRAHQFAQNGNWQQAEHLVNALIQKNSEELFVRDLAEAIRRRGSLPSLERLPFKLF